MSDPNIYTIGWISAITTEFVAAIALLDDRHDAPKSVSQHDNNSYSLGRMGRHNVVIATLPKSEYGTTAAATVARDMVHSFPNVRIGLMVGIGGGAPSQKHDIRLGDVVVGTRDLEAGKGGVIQYDYGKTIQDRAFTLTGSLNQAPQVLLTAVSSLEAQHLMEGHKLNIIIQRALDEWPRLRKTHARPISCPDRLYKPQITHPSTKPSLGCSQVCGEEPSHLVHRDERDADEDNPAIHYGLIASGNQLMKDASVRNKLADELGVLCFEMEAAGLMNHFPCLVVRGICDYSDTHKNKQWQGFAAMTAAAYARGLLEQVTPVHIDTEDKIADAVNSFTSEQEEKRVLEWLAAPDASVDAGQAIELRCEGTAEWIFETAKFQQWKNGSCQSLWLHGMLGCGKTILSASISDHLGEMDDRLTLYFFFKFSDSAKQTVSGMVRALILQAYHRQDVLREPLRKLYQSHNQGQRHATSKELSDCLQEMLRDTPKVCVVLDALDECSQTHNLLDWLVKFLDVSKMRNVQCIATSRPEGDLVQRIPSLIGRANCIPLPRKQINSDIHTYIRSRLHKESGFQRWASDPSVLDDIHFNVHDKADGMFRLVACQLDDLEDCIDREAVEQSLEQLPRDLDETYERALNKIPRSLTGKAYRLLQFLIHSAKPLSIREAAEVIAIRADRFNPADRMPNRGDIVKLFPSLVMPLKYARVRITGRSGAVIDGEDIEQVQLAHFSVKEYLLNHRSGHFRAHEAFINITRTCLNYISSIPCSETTDLFLEFPLLWHASQYWMGYAEKTGEPQKVVDAVTRFFQSDSNLRSWARFCRSRMEKWYYESRHPRSLWDRVRDGILEIAWDGKTCARMSYGLYWACLATLPETAKSLISAGADVDAPVALGSTALGLASAYGSKKLVKVLLEAGANVDRCCDDDDPAVVIAASKGHLEIVQMLMSHGAQAVLETGNAQPKCALTAAVAGGHQHVLGFLLRHEYYMHPHIRDTANDRALTSASANGQRDIVSFLLDHGASIQTKKEFKGPHSCAVEAAVGNEGVLSLLLGSLGSPGLLAANCYHLGLSSAIHESSGGSFRRLCAVGEASSELRGDCHGWVLEMAVNSGEIEAVNILLSSTLRIDCGAYKMSLHAAVEYRHSRPAGYVDEVITVLVSSKPQNTCAIHGKLSKCFDWSGPQHTIEGLLANQVTIDCECEGDFIRCALENDRLGAIQSLFNLGFDVAGYDSGNAFGIAVAAMSWRVIRLFLAQGLEVHGVPNDTLAKLVSRAVSDELIGMLRVLLESEIGHIASITDNLLVEAFHQRSWGILQLLLVRGSDFTLLDEFCDGSFVRYAIQQGQTHIITTLLEMGTDVDKYTDGDTVLSAFEEGSWEFMQVLVAKGQSLTEHDRAAARKALVAAIRDNKYHRVAQLLAAGAAANARSDRGSSLGEAILRGSWLIAALLIKHGADVNAPVDSPPCTPLFLAASKGNAKMVHQLLKHGADATIRGGFDGTSTALDIAANMGHENVFCMLTKHLNAKDATELNQPQKRDVGSQFLNLEEKVDISEKRRRIDGGSGSGGASE